MLVDSAKQSLVPAKNPKNQNLSFDSSSNNRKWLMVGNMKDVLESNGYGMGYTPPHQTFRVCLLPS